MGRKTFRREARIIWKELNRPTRTGNAPWYVPKIPSILQMLVREGMLSILTIGLWSIEVIGILGENVFWQFSFVDQLYKNIGSNQFDVFTVVSIMTWFLIMGVGGIVWVLGYWDRWVS